MSSIREAVNAVYLSDSRRVLATLIRLLGDFDVAEEGLHEAFAAALEQWPRDGVPANPRAWLVSTRRVKGHEGRRGGGGRPPAADLHVLPSGPAAEHAGRHDDEGGLRPQDRGDCRRVPDRAV